MEWKHTLKCMANSDCFQCSSYAVFSFFPRLILGAALGYMLVWSGSLWLPIVAHFTNNAFAVVTYFIGIDKINPSVESMGSEVGSIV